MTQEKIPMPLQILTPQEHEAQLLRLEILLRDNPDSEDIEPLVDLIESYENIHYPYPVISP